MRNIRQANRSDVGGIAVVHVDSWKTTYKNIVPSEFLETMSYENSTRIFQNIFNEMTKEEVIFVAEQDNKIVGFAYVGPERSNNENYKSELYSIYISEDYQNMNIGKQLLVSVAEDLLSRGITTMLVEVLSENKSRFFYEHMGAKLLGEKDMNKIKGAKLKKFLYGWVDVHNIIK